MPAGIFAALGLGLDGIFGDLPNASGFIIFGVAMMAWTAALAITCRV
jgi:hypothetical protein